MSMIWTPSRRIWTSPRRQKGFICLPAGLGFGRPNTPPYQDFTSYTEVDPSSKISVTASRVTISSMDTITSSYVYKDFGVGNFSGNFSFDFDVVVSSSTGGAVWSMCCLANAVSALTSINDRIHADAYNDGSLLYLRLIERVSGTAYIQTYAASAGTAYFCRLVRDESVGSFGTCYLKIASSPENRNSETWINTLTQALHSNADFRYLYSSNNLGAGTGTRIISGYVENFLINAP